MADLFNPKGMSFGSVPSPGLRQSILSNVGDPPPSPSHINRQASGAANSIEYLLDRPKYHMRFAIYDYSRANIQEIGRLSRSTRWGMPNEIVMPLSDQLIDPTNAKWEQEKIPWLVAEGVRMLDQYYRPGQEREAVPQGPDTSQGGIWEGIKKYGGRAILSTDVAGARATVSTMFGIAPNQFVTILFIGPEYKKFQFQWTLSPNHPIESDNLKIIINTFKKAMSPHIAHSVLWGYPNVFRVMFMPNNSMLYKFKPCVLQQFQVNYTPLGRAGFYAGREAPASVTIQASFIELEYWTKETMSSNPNNDTNFPD